MNRLVSLSLILAAGLVIAAVLSSGLTILKSGDVPEDEIKIGVLLPLSGNMKVYGIGFKEGIGMAVSDINNKGGIRGVPVSLEVQDSFGNPNIAVFGFKRLHEMKIPVIIGDASSTNTLKIAPLAEEKGVVLISPGSTSPELSQYKNYVFRTISSDTYQGRGIAKVLTSLYPDAENVSVVYINNDYGDALASSFTAAFEDKGRNVRHMIKFEDGCGDYSSIGRRLKDQDPDAIVLISYSSDAADIMNAAKLHGLEDKVWIGSEGLIDEELITGTGNYSEGMVATMQANRIISGPFTKRYKEEFNTTTIDWPVPYGYDAMMMVAEVIDAKGYEPESISEGLKEIRYVGVCGAKSFDENGDIYPSYDVLQVRDGEWVQIRWNEILYRSEESEKYH